MTRETLGSRLGFILISAGCAIGIGNVWRFPWLAGQYGGAWFVLVYSRSSGPIGVGTALGWCVLPYLLPDAVKLTLAALLTGRLYPLLQKGQRP